ncbi:hypothetical protein ACFYY5_29200 [Nocardia elegans]|uniref:Uncharacterized protein n=1 Tax=Nocardia elegans TaxID=300029 RepID=A0ABW6TP04_9NOCA
MTATAAQIAKAAGIAPRTKHFVLRDEYGFALNGGRTEHVLTAIQRVDGIDQRTRVAASALFKCYTTGRMNIDLARRVREQYSPYQLCGLVVKIANAYDGVPTIGDLADFWINEHRNEF